MEEITSMKIVNLKKNCMAELSKSSTKNIISRLDEVERDTWLV